ncbi:protein OXIDATIVE STRESS 3 LIKE 1-like [Actinidia eriantha]|uniref:protein OXIDATIVE STRESS 3 LIKE 1-like n=1 Tax=Actinidia eriantha TaxID=165200 RepID=UPI0025881FFC|nr:protein OXIDATIVE STRESS 3 LIKE 1-like [Actinidia eriantha]
MAEVQSPYKGGPLNNMDAFEEVLPIKRGLSKFYNGKSKSFGSSAHLASSSSSTSIQVLAKPEIAYTSRRRNLFASSACWDKNRSSPLRSTVTNSGISKRTNSVATSKSNNTKYDN